MTRPTIRPRFVTVDPFDDEPGSYVVDLGDPAKNTGRVIARALDNRATEIADALNATAAAETAARAVIDALAARAGRTGDDPVDAVAARRLDVLDMLSRTTWTGADEIAADLGGELLPAVIRSTFVGLAADGLAETALGVGSEADYARLTLAAWRVLAP